MLKEPASPTRWRTVRDGTYRGHRLVAVFDVAAGAPEERARLPTWGSLTAFYGGQDEEGMPSLATAARLEELEGRLRALLGSSGESREVGVITTDGRRELIVYTAAADHVRQVARTLQGEFPELELQLTMMSDTDWTVFRQFVPDNG